MDSKNSKMKIICVGNQSREIADYLHEEAIPGADIVTCDSETNEESIKSVLNDHPDLVVIFNGPVGIEPDNTPLLIARTIKESGILTVGITTLPPLSEGEMNIFIALDFASELSKYTDAMMTLNMENILGDSEASGCSAPNPLRTMVQLCSQQLRYLADLMNTSGSIDAVRDALKDSSIFHTGIG